MVCMYQEREEADEKKKIARVFIGAKSKCFIKRKIARITFYSVGYFYYNMLELIGILLVPIIIQYAHRVHIGERF